jgi:hypothetical protein
VVAAFFVGSVAGALLTGTAIWIVSGLFAPLPRSVRFALLAAGAALAWLAKEGPLQGRLTLPESRRLIPSSVLGGSVVRGAAQFGFELGTGVRTYVPSAIPYILVGIIAFGQLTLADALLIAMGFGIGRGLPMAAQLSSLGSRGDTVRFLRPKAAGGRALAHLVVILGVVKLVI